MGCAGNDNLRKALMHVPSCAPWSTKCCTPHAYLLLPLFSFLEAGLWHFDTSFHLMFILLISSLVSSYGTWPAEVF